MKADDYRVKPGKKFTLNDFDPGDHGGYKGRSEVESLLAADIARLDKYQSVLYADNSRSVLVVLQAMDTAGKDGTIRHVMTGVNPASVEVHSFKAPSKEDLD